MERKGLCVPPGPGVTGHPHRVLQGDVQSGDAGTRAAGPTEASRGSAVYGGGACFMLPCPPTCKASVGSELSWELCLRPVW